MPVPRNGAGNLGEPDRFRSIQLGPLSQAEGVTLAHALAPDIDDAAANTIWARAAGLPFWIDGLARSSDVNDSLFECLYGRRIATLGVDGEMALSALVVAGRPITFGELARCRAWSSERSEAAIAELVDHALVVLHGGTARLAHDLLREGAAGGLDPAEVRELHRRWAAVIEEEAGQDVQHLRSALEHRRAAGQPVAELARAIAVSPRRRWLGRDGARELATIVDGMARGEPGRLELVGAVAALASEIGDSELALGLWSVVAEGVADPDERVRAAVAAAREAFELGKADESRAWLERCRSAGRLPPEVAIAADLLEASVANWLDYRLAERRRWRLVRRALTAVRLLTSSPGGSGAPSPAVQRVSRQQSPPRSSCLASV